MKIKCVFNKYFVTIAALISFIGFGSGCNPNNIEENPNNIEEHGIRIIDNFFPNSQGLEQDFKIYKQTFGDNGISLRKETTPSGFAYINLFLEIISPEYVDTAKYNWFMVNQEVVESVEHLRLIDLVICKTQHAVDLMKNVREKNGLNYKIVYTKFTSLVEYKNRKKNYNLFLHSAQKSARKNTGAVVDCWKNHPEFPLLQGTCFSYCREEELNAKGHADLENFSNISLANEPLPWEQYKVLRASAGVHVVPSSVEGYGHYINEASASGAIVITTDAPPMNELVEHGFSGFLVRTNGSREFNQITGSRAYRIDPDHLAEIVEQVQQLSVSEREWITASARQRFLEDTQYFQEKIHSVSESLKTKGNLSEVEIL